MGVALLSLKVMIGFNALFLLAAIIGVLATESAELFAGNAVGLAVQLAFLAGLLAFLKKGPTVAKWLFGAWCVFLFLNGIMATPEFLSVIDYGLAVLGFVGLAGLWQSRQGAPREISRRGV